MNLSDFRAELVRKMENPVEPEPFFSFGRYRGETVESVLERDPSYILWCWRNVEHHKLPFTEGDFVKAKLLSRPSEVRRVFEHGIRYGGGLFSHRFSEPYSPFYDTMSDDPVAMSMSGFEFQFEELDRDDVMGAGRGAEPWRGE